MMNLHYLPEMIVEHVRSRNSFGISVEFSREADLLDTGGGLKKARSFFEKEEAFFVHNCDVYSEINLSELYKNHVDSRAIATLAVMSRPTKRGLYFDSTGQLCGWSGLKDFSPKNDHRFVAFSGIQVLSPEIFRYMPEQEKFSIIETYLTAARAGKPVRALDVGNSYWIDMGTPEKLKALTDRLA